ncbi:hypothetical protein KI387_031139 [Taxus chinensis]|uniref:Peptidylprolyl isomerase n=1 Tax=Taxus chinensis TaxID=29808 RepID=A0AA38FF35_TAXCH|nr:hypothetical protein KI387_031139 [Taxus chinensis]
MGRRQQETEGLWKPCATLLLITFISCTVVYIVLSPLFKHHPPSSYSSEASSHARFNLTEAHPGKNIKNGQPECCRGRENLELWGKVVKWGSDFKVNTPQECCRACKSTCKEDGECLCNSWVFCGDKKRCGGKFGECWLKQQEDPLYPEEHDSAMVSEWTSGLIFKKGVGIVALETGQGKIHIKLLPDCAPRSVAYMFQLLRLRHCAGCEFYRAEKRGNNWDINGNHISQSSQGPPYALLQGTLEAQGLNFEEIPKETCPSIKRGSVAWVDGGPEFFISLANHDEWDRKYTVFASVLPEDMAIVEEIVELPTQLAIWSGIKVAVLEKQISLRVKRAANVET